jgi:hypothetical protein
VDRWGRIRPSTAQGWHTEARLPVDAVARGAPGCALVLGPEKELYEVALTPAHQRSPWRELVGAALGRARDVPTRDVPTQDVRSRDGRAPRMLTREVAEERETPGLQR